MYLERFALGGMEGVYPTKCIKPGLFSLTFDDGPSNFTTQFLDVLERENIKGTFFINGYKSSDVTQQPYMDMVKRIYERHELGSHSYDHLNFGNLDLLGIYNQMHRNDQVIGHIIGKKCVFMRPPFGISNEMALRALHSWGYFPVWRSITSKDTSSSNLTQLQQYWKSYEEKVANSNPVVDSFISLEHDTIELSLQFIQNIIPIVKAKGYKIVPLSECLGITPYSPIGAINIGPTLPDSKATARTWSGMFVLLFIFLLG
jgi:peptidoglycan/xylan/chitin deacetylase (PgdA/CDA1 family)